MIGALIFDFDGLIIDTEEADFRSWAEVYQEHGCELPFDTWRSNIGYAEGEGRFDAYAFLEEQLGRSLDRESIRTRRRRRLLELIDDRPVRPGVETYLADAKRLSLKLAVASSAPRWWVEDHLGKRGLRDHFAHVTCVDDVERGKPDPAVYLTTLRRLNLSADRAVALEDSPTGARAARRAGIYCVAVPNPITRGLPFDHADRLVDSLADLPLAHLLAELAKR